jgi:NUMOD4 motif
LDDIKGEIWKEIPYTEGYYLISNFGRVKGLERLIFSDRIPNGRRLKERILALDFTKHYNKYTSDYAVTLRVKYSFEKTKFTSMVGRLVYEAFSTPKKKETMDSMVVYPIDGNGFNCKAENLSLITRSELRRKGFQNNRYENTLQRITKKERAVILKKTAEIISKKIDKYSIDGTLLATYPSLTSAAKQNGISISCVGLCAQKKIKVLKGFVFRYAADKYSGEHKTWDRTRKIPVVKYSMGGKKIQTYPGIKIAAASEKIHPNCVSSCAYKKAKHAGGYVWRFMGERYDGEYKDILKKRKCIQLSIDGKIIKVFDSVSQAVSSTGASFTGIKRVIEGRCKTCKGFVWKWK